MNIDKKTFLPPLLIFALFFSALASLMLSGLSVSKAVAMQNDVTSIFLKSIQSSNAITAIADSGIFVLQNAVLPLLPFLLFSSLGFLAVLFFRVGTKKLAASLAGVFVSVLALVFAGQNPALLIIPLGYFALLLPIEFGEKKTNFKTGYAFSSFMLRFLNIAVAIAVFAAVFTMPNFDNVAEQQMISGAAALLPDINELQQAQNAIASDFINQASASVKNIVSNEYSALTEEKRTQCSEFNKAINSEIDSYKSQILSQLQAGNASIGTEQLAKDVFSKVGIFSAMAKALPLTAALSLFILLEMLKPLLGLIGGAVYSLAARKFGKSLTANRLKQQNH